MSVAVRNIKNSNLNRLETRGPLEDIGNQKTSLCPKFTQDMQAKLLWGLSSNTWHSTKIGESLVKKEVYVNTLRGLGRCLVVRVVK